jgi:hypothetical protein
MREDGGGITVQGVLLQPLLNGLFKEVVDLRIA